MGCLVSCLLPPMDLSIRTLTGETFVIQVRPWYTVDRIKECLEEREQELRRKRTPERLRNFYDTKLAFNVYSGLSSTRRYLFSSKLGIELRDPDRTLESFTGLLDDNDKGKPIILYIIETHELSQPKATFETNISAGDRQHHQFMKSTTISTSKVPSSTTKFGEGFPGRVIPQAEYRGITLRQLLHRVVVPILTQCETEGWRSTKPQPSVATTATKLRSEKQQIDLTDDSSDSSSSSSSSSSSVDERLDAMMQKFFADEEEEHDDAAGPVAVSAPSLFTRQGAQQLAPLLSPEEVTLYDLVHHFIKPSTQEYKCSFVELIAGTSGPDHSVGKDTVDTPSERCNHQTPRWFVSHWWGEPVMDFVACIVQHAEDHGLSYDTPYWVCAYAINQHLVEGEIGQDNPKDSPFYRAIQMSEGTLSVLDRNSVCYERIWCSYEIATAIGTTSDHDDRDDEGQAMSRSGTTRHAYEAYTLVRKHDEYGRRTVCRAVGLTDGPVPRDKYLQNNDGSVNFKSPFPPQEWIKKQFNRQQDFPLDTCRKAFRVRIEKAQASREEDRKKILHDICGTATTTHAARTAEGHQHFALTSQEPPKQHVKYDETNALLRGKFAVDMYRHILQATKSFGLNGRSSQGPNQNKVLEECRLALAAAPIKQLSISFNACYKFRGGEPSIFAEALPTTLESLDLDYGKNTGLTSSDQFAHGFRRLSKLRSFRLCCDESYKISSLSCLAESLSFMSQLEELRLVFSRLMCPPIGDVALILETVSRTSSNLKVLHLDLSHCPDFGQEEALWDALASLVFLEDLNLNLSSIREKHLYDLHPIVTNIDGLGQALGYLPNLKSLALNFEYSCVNALTSLGDAMRTSDKSLWVQQLTSLEMNFYGSPLLKEKAIVSLCTALTTTLPSTTRLRLKFGGSLLYSDGPFVRELRKHELSNTRRITAVKDLTAILEHVSTAANETASTWI